MHNRFKRATCLLAFAATLIPLSTAWAGGVAPPWSAPVDDGFEFTVTGIDNAPDLHGNINDPQLVIFFAGNQYMAVNELIRGFRKSHPQYSRVFAETLPPGKLVQQIESGSMRVGNMRMEVQPDVFTAGRGRMDELQKKNDWFLDMRDYATNKLAIMTFRGNPYGIKNWQDLSRAGITLCLPNPKFEGIAEHAIIPALKSTGGQQLADAVYKQKVADGSAFLTTIHHRQTPLRVMQHQCDAGPVWYTEALFHAEIANHATSTVEIPDKQNHRVTYTAGTMKNAPHEKAAKAFMAFLTGPEGQAIYRKYGFMPPNGD